MAKLNIDRATVRQLFKTVVKASDEINEKSIVYGQAKRVLPLQPLVQASKCYVPNGNHDRIALTTKGHPDVLAVDHDSEPWTPSIVSPSELGGSVLSCMRRRLGGKNN